MQPAGTCEEFIDKMESDSLQWCTVGQRETTSLRRNMTGCKENLFHLEDNQAVEEAAEKGHGIFSLEPIQDSTG